MQRLSVTCDWLMVALDTIDSTNHNLRVSIQIKRSQKSLQPILVPILPRVSDVGNCRFLYLEGG